MPHPISAALAFAAALLCAPVPLEAPSGIIEGAVRNRSGVPIANAQVQIVGQPYSTLTDSAGAYRLSSVPVGTYRIRVAFVGYQAAEQGGVAVRAGKTTRADF